MILFGACIRKFIRLCLTRTGTALGGVFHIQNVINSGSLSYIPQDFEGYVKDFKIAYNDEGAIDQFYSDSIHSKCRW